MTAKKTAVETTEQGQPKVLTFRERVIALQNELKAPKSRYNSFANYAYRSCEDILEAVKPLCQKYGLLLNICDYVELIGERYYVKAVASLLDLENKVYDDGTEAPDQETSIGWARESDTKKGLDSSQITGTASSYARKYALNALLLIDDTKDPDSDEYGKQTGKAADWYMAEIAKQKNIADLELFWNKYADDMKALPEYKQIFAQASAKGKELNANEGRV